MDLRPVEASELADVRDLIMRSFEADGVPEVLELDELAEELDDDHIVLATDTRVVEIDGAIAGAAWTYYLASETKEERCYINGTVDPTQRGRGIGTLLLEWATHRAADQLQSSTNDLPKFIRVDNFEFVESAHRLYAQLGFTPVRYNDELLRSLEDLPSPRGVDGVGIVPWPDDRDEEIRLVKNAAFADHWGSTPSSQQRWHQSVRGFGARTDLSFIAQDTEGRVIAACLNNRYEADDELLGRSDGWINSLGTLAEWRGKGIGSALVIQSLHAFAAAGLTHASIGVDSENPTGAAELYRSLGFEPNQRSITHQIEL